MPPRPRPLLAALLLMFLVACTPRAAEPLSEAPVPAAGTATPEGAQGTPEPVVVAPTFPGPDGAWPWWNDAVFYEVFVRSFQDSDGDGVGDIEGLIQRLDYLQELGVSGLWLMPIMESPTYHGYDVADYYAVDREYGDNAAFARLMEEAHARGMRVIVDLVINHTADDHPWFQAALDPASPFREWYVWSESEPQAPNWHRASSGYYYGYFWNEMPDLNFRTPAVGDEIHKIARFWLEEMGVDGFRMDAIKYLIEDGSRIENTPATHAWLEEFHRYNKGIEPEALVVGEVWSSTEQAARYVPAEMDLTFAFDLASSFLHAVLTSTKDAVEAETAKSVAAYPPLQFASFITNHDQPRARGRFANDEQAKLAATLLLTSPGVPFLYYGEEIGMVGNKPDEFIRRPMQWSAGEGGGFTSGTPWEPFFEDLAERNVEAQSADPGSLLNHYRTLIRLRNEHSALRVGEWLPLETGTTNLYAYLRHHEDEVLLVLVNLGRRDLEEYALDLEAGPLAGGEAATLLLGDGEATAPEVAPGGGFTGYRPLPLIPGRTSAVIRLAAP